MTREISKLQAVEQDILQKISAPPPRPETALARKPLPRSSGTDDALTDRSTASGRGLAMPFSLARNP